MQNKEKVSYAIFFAMIKLELARTGLELAADMILLDYELAIEQAASDAWPNILIQKRTDRNKDKKTMIRISRTSRRPPMKQNGLLGSNDGRGGNAGRGQWHQDLLIM